MSKKMMLLVLGVVSAAILAPLPAMASAQEIHFEPAEEFKTTGQGGEFGAEGEPAMTCTNTEGTGKFDAGSTTTGTYTNAYTGCHMAVFGFTASCKTTGAGEAAGKIVTGGAFHLVTWNTTNSKVVDPSKPAILLTSATTTLVCAGISSTTRHGEVIGTITSPKCGESSRELRISFTATGNVQDHTWYTGKQYDLTVTTSDGVAHTAALVETTTNTQASAGKLNCT
jgi:hypothetical protein